MKTTFAAFSTMGKVRKTNQDNFYLNGQIKPMKDGELYLKGKSSKKEQIFAVCDGMGGETSGEIAAYYAVECLKDYRQISMQAEQAWKSYIDNANDRICQYRLKHRIRMGTTFAGCHIYGSTMRMINVGDSRVYQIREGKIVQLSKDHTEFQMMLEAGVFKKEDYKKTSASSHLTQFLGILPDEMELEPFSVEHIPIKEEDKYLICSDGLYGVVDDEEMLKLIETYQKPADCCRKLIDKAEENGSRDNITALIICVKELDESITGLKKVLRKLSKKEGGNNND